MKLHFSTQITLFWLIEKVENWSKHTIVLITFIFSFFHLMNNQKVTIPSTFWMSKQEWFWNDRYLWPNLLFKKYFSFGRVSVIKSYQKGSWNNIWLAHSCSYRLDPRNIFDLKLPQLSNNRKWGTSVAPRHFTVLNFLTIWFNMIRY